MAEDAPDRTARSPQGTAPPEPLPIPASGRDQMDASGTDERDGSSLDHMAAHIESSDGIDRRTTAVSRTP